MLRFLPPETDPPTPKRLRLPSTDPLEREIEAAVCKRATALGYYVRKFVSPAHRSVPDRLLITPKGHLFFIEFKRHGFLATEAQAREHQTIEAHGYEVHIIDTKAAGLALIEEKLTCQP
jgi:hypothetical protein